MLAFNKQCGGFDICFGSQHRYIYVCTQVYILQRTHIHTRCCAHTNAYAHTCTCAHACTHVRAHTQTQTHTHTQKHTHTQTHTHTHTHTHTKNTPILLSNLIHSVVVKGREVFSSNDGNLNSLKLPSEYVAVPVNGSLTSVSILAAMSSNTCSPLTHEAYKPLRQCCREKNMQMLYDCVEN